ncbi:filamentous haemagglutinin family protein [Methylotenera sp. N17]|uniref:filamentous haemagglutinin family protein n=1 Tax=Methylotenera sp. N17 TaxID=1502761 RepID=UPI000646D406|nr:filamentous haemagglutinin family protein [Methylotenera sp. N17]
MNQGIYKLVYSRVLHMMVPVSEAAKGHVSKSGRRIRKQVAQALQYTLMLSFTMVGNAWAETVLLNGNVVIQSLNNAELASHSATNVTFRNLANAATGDFAKLNIQRGQSLDVLMNAGQSFLARIHDVDPSILNGSINAAGSLYFINANGIIIGKDAQFNVGSLYAGTLNITDEMFQSGFVNDQTFTKAFELVGTLDLTDAARAKVENAQVLVQGGAQITTANNGKVMLFAPNVKVEKEGVVTDINGVVQKDANGNAIMRETLIRTPEGQTILAAGKKIYLKGATDPAGFLVEVDAGGSAVNLGKIVAERGNITMMGLAVNQGGTLTATTSVRANGSIKLIAQDRATETGVSVVGARNGSVTLAKGSVTEVKPDYADKEETIVSQPFKTSDVTIEASLINIDGKVSVKGGNVTAKSEFDASSALKFDSNGNVDLSLDPTIAKAGVNKRRIYLGENASIDVSGVDAIAPMSRNQLTIQLFSDQLKDNPILRNSGLFKQTVYVDARKGTDLLDIQPFLDLVGATVAEKMTNAGTVTLSTNQDLIISKGAVIDVSGGSTTYTAGTVKESQLLYNGKLVPISEAKTGVAYDQVADSQKIVDEKWGTVKTYTLGGATQQVNTYFEGANAGTVNLTTPVEAENTQNLVLAGQLIANTKVSKEQLLAHEVPKQGRLLASANKLTIDKQAKALPSEFNFNQALADSANYQSVISSDFLANGFNDVDLSKVTQLTVNTQLNINPHGQLILGNSGVGTITNINASIYAPNSDILLQSLRTNIADNVTLSTAGIFTNDRPVIAGAQTREVAADGGNITAGLLSLGKNVTLDASAGAWVDSAGTLHTGEAGDISFKSNQNIDSSIRLQSYGFDHGGRLAINFINVDAQDGELAATLNIANNLSGDFTVNNGFFSQGGFSEYALSAHQVNIGAAGGTAQQVYGVAQNWQINAGYLNQSGGQAISAMAKPVVQADYLREAVSLDFTANRVGNDLGTLTLAENTTLRTDRGGSVSLSAGKQVNVLGDITTPSGHINIRINDKDIELPNDATQAVYIGENAYLSAAGSTVTLPGSRDKLLKTQVFDAGTIDINKPEDSSDPRKGATIIKQGAVLDVSGASVVNDTQTTKGYVRETLYGDAGTISLNGTGALLVDGDFKASASGTGRDGTLNMVYNARLTNDFSPVVSGTETVVLTNDKQLSAAGFSMGDAIKDGSGISAPYVKAQLSADQIEQGGFANVTVKSFLNTPNANDKIELANGFSLNIAGNLTLETPILHVQNDGIANINAGHITFKSPTLFLDPSSVVAGNGQLTTQSKQVYVDGLMGVSGTQQLAINTDLDIHGQGTRTYVQDGAEATESGLTANGEITLTARQIYPDSGAKLKFEALGTASKVTVNSNGKAATPVLSAGGELTLKAADVVQNGVLTAPFGRINLVGSNSVTLTSNSKTSISGSGQNIPFGITTTGGEVFNPSGGATRPLVEKTIDIDGKNVDLQQGAVLDLSAGGDMFAYEWVPGIGGSKDILAQPNTYAVIPTLKGEFAPTDLTYAGSSAGVGVGQSVYLSGVPGLPPGMYTLLPARYALVPGAYVVQTQSTNVLPGTAVKQQDGSTLTAGYFGDVSTGARDANWSTFKVLDGAIFRPATGAVSQSPSQYILTSANTFFNNPLKTNGAEVNTPLDVGKLSLSASQLALNAHVIANTQVGGNGLEVDISSGKIRVVDAQDNSNDGSLQLTAASLNALNAESVLLGGKRQLVKGVTDITTVADSVVIENTSAQVLRTTEFIATANQQVVVNANAVINTGAAAAKPGEKVITSNGQGAVLALSSKNNITYSRNGGSASATQGELIVHEGSQLIAGNSAVLDATNNVSLKGDVKLSDGGKVTLGAKRILIGDAPQGTAGLNVTAASLAALGQLKALTLNSYSNIDTFGAVNVGNNNLDLTFNAAGIVGHLAAGESGAPSSNVASVITANTFTLKNNQDAVLIGTADNSGRALNINANTVRFEGEQSPVMTNGQLATTDQTTVQGYSQLNINAGEVRTAATGQTNLNVAQTNINAGRITSETGGKYTLKASDTLNTQQNTTVNLGANTQFGGQLTIAADRLNVASNIESLSGQVTLQSNQDLTLASGASISANSQTIGYYTTTQHLNAGKVTLSSANGNVNVDTGAAVSVTSTGDAKAGMVQANAMQGTLNLNGTLNGKANGTGLGGQLDVDVKTLASLTATDQKATGFSESRHYRARTGDVAITGTGDQALTARDISVSADAGNIRVSGDIVATAPKNSRVGLYANQNLTLESTANIQANSTKSGEAGGKVELFTQQGTLALENGSKINVAGGTGGAGGDVHLRAPRTGAGAGNDVAVSALATAINGAKSTVLEAFKVFTGVTTVTTGNSTGATLGFNTVANDVTDFMANKGNIVASLGKSGDDSFHLRAGTEIQSSGNLTVVSDWNLYSETRAGNEPGVLTLRAADNLMLNGSISDGFTTALPTGLIGSGDAWAYRLVAGADFNAASPLSTIASAKASDGSSLTGNITLANNKLIRTGTGDIDIATGGDVIMRNASSAIYTVGTQAQALDGFDAPTAGNPLYLTNGGDIRVTAQGNIVGAEPASGRQLINQWLFRQGGGNSNLDTTWWVRPDLFKQSLATLGGGDIELRAGGDISNFSASAPTTARFDNFGTTGDLATNVQRIDGGGDVTVVAGNNINGGVYFVAKGDGDINAGGAIQPQEGTFGTVLALQDGQWNVNAGGNVHIDAIINPTLVAQSTTNAPVLDATGRNSYFNTYAPQASVHLASVVGDVNLAVQNAILTQTTGLDNSITNSLLYAPANISMAAYQGDVNVGDVTLMPAASGNLNVFAAQNVGLGNVSMSDADPNILAGINTPSSRFKGFTNTIFSQLLTHSPSLLHGADTQASYIVAKEGDIFANVANAIVSLPKATKLVAGNDITGLNIALQNNRTTDISVIKAGNDVNTQNITVAGPGELLVQAGRNIDLIYPNVTTITTTGNSGSTNPIFNNTFASRANTALPNEGASITLQAGLGQGAAVQAYINQYVLPTGTGPVTLAEDAKRLAEYRKATAQAVTDFMRKRNGDNTLSDDEALAQFSALDVEAKTIFANRHLTSELIGSAKDFAKAGNHARGENAIASLFPTLSQGDILLFNSKVSTNSGGSIDLIAPGGLINVGVPGRGGDIGIITEKGGEIRAIADGDFQVNQSKVITQFGSDIAIWSTHGTIDAGRGSKTATSVPERIVQTDAFGNTIIEVRGVAAGSGIRAQSYDPDGPNGPKVEPKKGTVYLTAPTIDAGEAGIEAGDLFAVTQNFLNAINVQIQGTSSGVPIAATSSIAGVGAGLSPDAVNSATQSVVNSVAQSANNSFVKPTLPSIISVDVIGFGN